jgi:hypothetical protein
MSKKAEGRETFDKIERLMKTEYSFLRRMDKGATGSRYGGAQKRYSLGKKPDGKKWTRTNTPRLYITMQSDYIEVEVVLKKEMEGAEKVEGRYDSEVGIALPTGKQIRGHCHVCDEELQLRRYNFVLENEFLHHTHALALISYIIRNGVA